MKAPTQSPAKLLAPGRALTFANVAEGAEGLVVSDLARAVAARPNPMTGSRRMAESWRND
jgi:transcription-repair coupling factor (superfamily II helicase)